MIERCKGILFAFILGVIIPSLVVSFTINITKDLNDGTREKQTEQYKISVLTDNNRIVELNLNDYLTGVVLCEMPAEFEFEALKAQAVVARTYALRRSEGSGKHEEAAVCMRSNCCQGYKDTKTYLLAGGKKSDVEKIEKAVLDTDGMVLTYQGDLIDATYFSCSGGMTEDAKEVWGEDVPYLQATVSPGEEKASHYMDTVTFSVKEFTKALSLDLEQFRFEGIEDIAYTAGGGVDTLTVCGQGFKGTELRKKLKLKSTAFIISVVGDTVTVTTRGFGHRVGMSQYGADAMAVTGANFEEILKHYYQNVEITEMRSH